jgi:hypothetical protein
MSRAQTTKEIREIREWWTKNAMTYSDVHGQSVFRGEAYEP